MGLNIGYLKSDKLNDENWTPRYGVEPIMKYIPTTAKIWCPFDTAESEYVKAAVRGGVRGDVLSYN